MASLTDSCALLVRALKDKYSGWDGVDQFGGTEDRLVRLYDEFCWPPLKIEKELEKVFKSFDHKFQEMVIGGPFITFSLCPHHLLPCQFNVHVAYIPGNSDAPKVLGISKLHRVSDVLSKRPILQEQYAQDIAQVLMDRLKPEGVGVSVSGHHGCMSSRGVKQHQARIVTNIMKGSFLDQPSTRAEFLAFVRNGTG